MRKLILLLSAIILWPSLTYGQNALHTNVAQGNVSGYVTVLPSAAITVTPSNLVFTTSSSTTIAPQPIIADLNGNYSFYAATCQTYTITITAAGFPGYTYNWTSPEVNGGVCNSINKIRYVDPLNLAGWFGSDPGAWINSAAGSGGVKIQLTSGTFIATTPIVLPTGTTLDGTGSGNASCASAQTCLEEANGANLAAFITATGAGVSINNMYIYGNLTNNAGSLDGIVANQTKFSLNYSKVDSFKRNNWVLAGATEDTRCLNSESFNAGNNGVEIQTGATDIFFTTCVMVNNTLYNVHSTGLVGGIHIIGGDYSGTAGSSDCIFLDGTASTVNTSQIVGIAINPCFGHGIHVINGNSIVISGNYISNVGRGTNNTFDGVNFNNFGDATISGNSIVDGSATCAGHSCMRYGINIAAESQKNELGPNTIRGAQTSAYNPGASDDVLGGPANTNNFLGGTLNLNGPTAQISMVNKSASSTTVYGSSVAGDANARFNFAAGGQMFWGPGNAASDVNVSRTGVGILTNSGTYQQVQTISNQGNPCTNGEIALSGGWQSTGSATVTAVAGLGQTCSWVITTGTTTAASPTITDTLTNPLPTATTVCEINIHGGTHTAAAGEGFLNTTLSATAPVFTFIGTPTAGGTTYFIIRRCGP